MALTIYTDSIGNKYLGYAGDVTNVATGQEVYDDKGSLLSSFAGNTVEDTGVVTRWRTDGQSINNNDNVHFGLVFNGNSAINLNTRDAGTSDIIIQPINGSGLKNRDRAVAYSNRIDMAVFAWDFDANNSVTDNTFWWAGEVKGNSNIASPQTRSGIFLADGSTTRIESFGVKQPDDSTKRVHLDTQAGASHNIDCGTDTARLFLIEDDGAGGDGGTVGYCENLYISKNPNLIIGGFVTLNGITDGGSEQAVVVGDWGTDAKILMRVYDGVN